MPAQQNAPSDQNRLAQNTPAEAISAPVNDAVAPVAAAPAERTTVQPASASGMDYAGWVLLGGGLLLVGGGAAFAMSRKPRRRSEAYTAPEQTVSVEPVAAAPAPFAPVSPEPVGVRAPVTARHDPVVMRGDTHQAALEALIAEAPSAANPFHSRRNRLRRANFLLRTGQATPTGMADTATTQEAVTQRDRWTEMSFGGQRAARVSWRPATR